MFGRRPQSKRVIARPLVATGFALALLAQSVSPAAAAVGDLDDSFDDNGKLLLDLAAGDDFFWDVAIQPGDQKIVAVGRRDPGDGDWIVVRFDTDGTLDATFGGGDGRVATDFSTGEDYAAGVALQDDGKIVVVGLVGASGGKFGIARFTSAGTLDGTFGGGDGKATTDFTSSLDYAWDVAIQDDDRIVVAGVSGGSDPRFAAARYNTNGTLDTGFSADGKATVNLTNSLDEATAVGIDADGTIVLAGYGSGSGGRVGLAALRPNGSRATGFSSDGELLRNLSSGADFAWDLAIQPDDKIVLAGRTGGANSKLLAMRFNEDGSTDGSFSGNGVQTVDVTSFVDIAYGLALEPGGNILLAGTADNEFFAVTRLTDTGAIDSSFAHGGTAIVNFTAGYDIATSVAVQADANVVVVGSSSGDGGQMSVARLLGT